MNSRGRATWPWARNPDNPANPIQSAQNIIPLRLLIGAGLLALLVAVAAGVWIGAGLIALALCVTFVVAMWARGRGDALVVAVALLLFWMPFQVTFSRLNISPQEIGIYVICLTVALFHRGGARQWARDAFRTTSLFMRVAALIFIAACLQSLLQIRSLNLLDSVNSLRVTVVFPMLFALLVACTMRTRNAARTLLQAFVAGAVAFAVFALALRVWGVGVGNGAVEGRLGSEASFLAQYHPNNLALYLVLALAFAPAIISEAVESYRVGRLATLRGFTGVVALMLVGAETLVLAVWLTYSRGAFVALIVGIVVALAILALSGQGILRRVAVGLLGLGATGLIGLALWQGTTILGRYALLFNPADLLSDPDVTFRIDVYARAIRVISDHPITGIGLQQFATTGPVPFSPHNTYLDLWVSAGFFAMLGFVLVVTLGLASACAQVRILSQRHNTVEMLYMLGIVAALVAFFAQGFVETYDVNPRIAPLIWMLAFGADVTLRRLRSQRSQRGRRSQPLWPLAQTGNKAPEMAEPIEPAGPDKPIEPAGPDTPIETDQKAQKARPSEPAESTESAEPLRDSMRSTSRSR